MHFADHRRTVLKLCRNRAFAFLFADGASEELSAVQAVDGHAFPQHFSEMKKKVGLAPAAIVSSRGSDSSVLRSLDANRPVRSNYPLIGMRLHRISLCIHFLIYAYELVIIECSCCSCKEILGR
jgi:hypothetical protein